VLYLYMVLIDTLIVLVPSELNDVMHSIISKTKSSLIRSISKHGYITKVKRICNISEGVVQHSPSCAVEYTVTVDVDVFNISENDIVDMTLNNVTSMGIFGECKHATIFVPQHELKNVDDVGTFGYSVGDSLRIKIIGKRITDTILCIGTELF